MALPVESRNDTLPVQDAAVPLAALAAVLATLTCMVSIAAKPTGGNTISRVTGVGVGGCATSAVIPLSPRIMSSLRGDIDVAFRQGFLRRSAARGKTAPPSSICSLDDRFVM